MQKEKRRERVQTSLFIVKKKKKVRKENNV